MFQRYCVSKIVNTCRRRGLKTILQDQWRTLYFFFNGSGVRVAKQQRKSVVLYEKPQRTLLTKQ